MPAQLRRALRRSAFILFVSAVPAAASAQSAATPQAPGIALRALPARLSDHEFWTFVTHMSEPSGYFRSENLVSNEMGYQYVLSSLANPARTGKVYLGVGPEQNFSYIAAMKPQLAIIFDIRRGNLLEHLLYKALFELSADRAEFTARLFSRPRPAALDSAVSADSLMNAIEQIAADSVYYRKNREAVAEVLTKKHGFALSADDMINLYWVYDEFYSAGPWISYSISDASGSARFALGMPTFAELLTAVDDNGNNRGFLATESSWQFLKEMHARNLIVPVVGDFAGPRSIRTVGDWLRERGGVVSAFYASNVEQYLFQDGKAGLYYDNVAQLPIDTASVFIRSAGGVRGVIGGFGPGMRAPNVLCSIPELLAAHAAGQATSYEKVLQMCR